MWAQVSKAKVDLDTHKESEKEATVFKSKAVLPKCYNKLLLMLNCLNFLFRVNDLKGYVTF